MAAREHLVIGGGYAGLLAAWRATERGDRVTLLESRSRLGGVVSAIELAGVHIDAGAESFSTVDGAMVRLLEELGLAHDIVAPARADARIIAADGSRSLIPHGLFGIPATLDDPELTAVMSPESLVRARVLDAAPVQLRHDATVADLVEARLGSEFVRRLVNPVIAGVHGSSADRVLARDVLGPVLRVLPELGSLTAAVAQVRGANPRPGAAVASVRGGMFRVIAALEAHLRERGARFHLDCTVTAIERSGPRWHVASNVGSYAADSLTIATGIAGASRLLDVAVPVHARGTSPIALDVALVALAVDSSELSEVPLGSGALVTEGSPAAAKGITHVSAKWAWLGEALPADRHIVRLSYGRNGVIPDGDLGQCAAADLRTLTEVNDAHVVDTRVIVWSGGLVAKHPVADELVEALALRAEAQGVELCGAACAGNGLTPITADHERRTLREPNHH